MDLRTPISENSSDQSKRHQTSNPELDGASGRRLVQRWPVADLATYIAFCDRAPNASFRADLECRRAELRNDTPTNGT